MGFASWEAPLGMRTEEIPLSCGARHSILEGGGKVHGALPYGGLHAGGDLRPILEKAAKDSGGFIHHFILEGAYLEEKLRPFGNDGDGSRIEGECPNIADHVIPQVHPGQAIR
ncbi:hypothetical protein MASR2M17_20300 [Aminivibrio sp.]